MSPSPALPALTLRGVRTVAVEVPLRFVLGTSAATVRAAPLLLVDVDTAEGVVGRTYIFCYRRSGARAIAHVVQEAAELMAGEAIAPVAIASTTCWWRGTDMFATALSVPANMIDIRMEPARASQVRTRVVFPVSSHNSRWNARSTSTM